MDEIKHIKFNKSLCGVDFLLNILPLKQEENKSSDRRTHTADFFQIIFIKKGKGTLTLNGKPIAFSDRSVVFISQEQRYQWDVKGSFEATLLLFQEEFLNEFFSDKYFTYRLLYFYQTAYDLHIDISESDLNEYLMKLSEIKTELVAPKTDSVHLIRSLLYYLLIRLNRAYAEYHHIDSAISKENTAYEFRQLVEKHIYSKQRIDDYTDLMNISRISLNKAVKKQFNLTTTDFIKSRLLFEIKMQLIYTNKTIDELSNEFHFSEANHFSRFVKKKTGQSPLELRMDYQNGRL